MTLRHPDTFIRYNDEFNSVHEVFKDKLEEPNFRAYMLYKAKPVWNPRLKK